MCRRRGRAFADRRVRSGPACSSVPAEQNGERRRTAPAKQLRQWRSVRTFSPENPPCCVRVLDTGHSITPEAGGRRSKTKPRRVDEGRSGSDPERLAVSTTSPVYPRKRKSSERPDTSESG